MRSLKESLPLKLLMAREAVMERFRPHLKEAGVTEQQWRVLRALREADSMDAGELAKSICLRMPSLSRILVDLVARKLIEKRDGLDRRFRTLRITSGGAALVDRLASLSESEYHEIEAAVGKEKYREIMSNLDALIRRLS